MNHTPTLYDDYQSWEQDMRYKGAVKFIRSKYSVDAEDSRGAWMDTYDLTPDDVEVPNVNL